MADGEPASRVTDIGPLKREHIYIAHIPVKIIQHLLSAASFAALQNAFAGCGFLVYSICCRHKHVSEAEQWIKAFNL